MRGKEWGILVQLVLIEIYQISPLFLQILAQDSNSSGA